MSSVVRSGADIAGHAVMAVIRGQVLAEQTMRAITTGGAGPDALQKAHAMLRGDERAIGGFLRRLQKALETRGPGAAA